jgi:hypothetical protein
MVSQILNRPFIKTIVFIKNKIILVNGRIYIPKKIRSSVFYNQYDTRTAEY